MKRFLKGLMIGLLILFQGLAWADSPIYQGFFWDSAPAAAYNSTKGEFLVVWNVYNPFTPLPDLRFFGPVMGQLISESGQKIGAPFEIIASGGVLPKVAYNALSNEYLVVAEQWFNTVGQRVSAIGLKIGGPVRLLTSARYPRVVYNPLAGSYLVTGAWLTGTVPDNCNVQIYSQQVSLTGQSQGAAVLVADRPHGLCADGARYALDYAPIVTAKTPQGRYLLAIETPTLLKMLDSQGKVLPVLYDQAHNIWYENLPFQQSKVGQPFNIDIAYGTWANNPAFFLVWGDIDQTVSGGNWTGIWGGIVEAEKELYYTIDQVSNEVFPISYQWDHVTYPDIYKQWKPVVRYNNKAGTFVVAWRETPGTDPRDLTNENHIRVNTVSHYAIPPQANLVVSSTTGTENPVLPALASSTKTSKVILAWEDYRNFLGDIYGTLFDATTRSTSGITPGGAVSSYWKSVYTGDLYTLGIRSDGSLWAWGVNYDGQLGLNDNQDRHVPTHVGNWSDWAAVAAGGGHTLGIRSDGSLWAWGYNNHGQLGLNDNQPRWIPTQIGSETNWAMVAAGSSHSLGIRSDGSLWAWGINYNGQLGLNDNQDRDEPTPVVTGTDWAAVAAGGEHTLGIRSDGSLWAWGYNYHGQLGLNDNQPRWIPTQIGSETNWAMVAAGFYDSRGIRSDGSLWAWGNNQNGQLGLNDTQDRDEPTRVGAWNDWVSVAAGLDHSLGIRSDGSLWAWGYNSNGQLGLNDTLPRDEPTRVGTGWDWAAVAAGGYHTLGIRSDGSLWAWGWNFYGQLGLNDTQNRDEPTRVLLPNTMIWLPLILKN